MKKLILFLLVCGSLVGRSQTCIRFENSNPSQMALLSRTVSIDRVDGTTITAYANAAELKALQALGYSYETVAPMQPKVLSMATTVEQMRSWTRYPTYDTYVAMMQQFAASYPSLCRLDTIGFSVDNRLILCVKLSSNVAQDDNSNPECFYSSTMHGDEVTGFYFMLRLIDTLLNGYGSNAAYTNLLNTTQIYINPLSNPDGTYHGSNNSVGGSQRYNANYVDLNRNYPDPFGTDPMEAQQPENTAMINYVNNHHFKVSANLHGGSEVLNYPWDSFTSQERTHPYRSWWCDVCKRFVDTCRTVSSSIFTDVLSEGYIDGGDWYVVSNGRQDYINYNNNCLEMTLEVSSEKTLSSDELNTYWGIQHHALVNYIGEVHSLPYTDTTGIETPAATTELAVYPNPTAGLLHCSLPTGGVLLTIRGTQVMTLKADTKTVDLGRLPRGIYILVADGKATKVVKR